MATLKFDGIDTASGRTVGVELEKLAACIGRAETTAGSLSTWNVTDQPAGSDVFSGLGTGGSDVAFSDLGSATLTVPGFYRFAVTASNGDAANVSIPVFHATALTMEKIKYASASHKLAGYARPAHEIRGTIRALGMAATQAGAEATLEVAATAPFYGTRPTSLGASTSDNYSAFGGH